MTDKTIIMITGGNTGLGFETAKALFRPPKAYTILLGSRSIEKGNTAVHELQTQFPQSHSEIVSVQVDIEDDKSIFQLFDHVAEKYGRLDVLINNAGGQFDQQYYQGRMAMRDMWNKTWNVNVTGTYIMTHTFVPLLLKSSDPRLIFITSGVSTLAGSADGSIKVNYSAGKGWPKQGIALTAYRSSKTGMNMMMREWERILREDGIKVWCISPGLLATGLGGSQEANKQMGAQDPSVGASFVRDVVEGARDQDVGMVVRRDDIQPW